MKIFYPKYHKLHQPQIDYSDGLPGCKHLEISQRVEEVLAGILEVKNCDIKEVENCDDAAVRAIHDNAYVDFLLNISKTIPPKQEYIPSMFRQNLNNSPLHFQGGMYCFEIGTPIGCSTIQAALNSANAALDAAKHLHKTNENTFILTRPPGHHAGKSRYGGYCFFNNAYIVANYLKNKNEQVAVFDIDYHIGDGSLEFATKATPYYSIHANPFGNYPYLDNNFTNNNPYVTLKNFPNNTTGENYVKLVKELVAQGVQSKPTTVVLSLGFDTLADDGYQDDKIFVTNKDFYELGKIFGELKIKTAILLEGGYKTDALKECTKNFMQGFYNI